MAACEQCGADYSGAFEVRMNGAVHTFDCFECAVEKLAPRCAHCSVKVIGHGLERSGVVYCCGHCADAEGEHARA